MALLEVFADLAQTTVAASKTAPSAGTVESWTVASSSSFPAVSAGATVFYVRDPANAAELIAVTAVSGTTWTVTRGANSTTPVTHGGGFTVIQTASAGALNRYREWQFPVEAYGAVGDGKIGTGGTGTSGSATFTDSGASFVNATAPLGDVGKVIVINQGTGGSNTNPATRTITAVGSATSVTLSAALTANAASAPYVYGTDDAAAVNSAIAAAVSYATAAGHKAQVIFGPKIHMLAAITQQTSPVRYNTHIPLPFATATAAKLYIDLIGAGFTPESQFWESEVPQLGGTVLMSAITPPAQPDATFGQFSVIGGPSLGSSQAGTFCNAFYVMDGITLCTPWNSGGIGFDGLYLAQMGVIHGRAQTFAPVNLSAGTVGGPWLFGGSAYSTNDTAIGFRFPTWGNNALSFAENISVEGFSIGYDIAEHFSALYLKALYADRPIQITDPTENPVAHGITIQHASVEQANYAVYVNGGTSGLTVPIDIRLLDMETITTAHVFDPSSNLDGFIGYNCLTSGHAVVTGGQNVTVIDTGKEFPGPWSGAPTAPASGTASTNAQQNLAYRYATVYCSATTAITNVFAGQASTGLTATGLAGGANVVVPVRVNPGGWFAVTYTGTLTTRWFLD